MRCLYKKVITCYRGQTTPKACYIETLHCMPTLTNVTLNKHFNFILAEPQ